MYPFRVPSVEENAGFVMVGGWMKGEGTLVVAGEPLVELISDKATYSLDADQSGVLLKILAPEKSSLPPGAILAAIGTVGETLPLDEWLAENDRLCSVANAALFGTEESQEKISPPGLSDLKATLRMRASPKARVLARTLHLEIEQVGRTLEKKTLVAADIEMYFQKYGSEKGMP